MRNPLSLSRWLVHAGLLGALALASAGCESHAGTGALVGGAGGAAIGGLIGSYSHARAGEGALIGGAIGALGGYAVGNEMDKAEDRHHHDYDRDRYYRSRYDDRGRYYEPAPPPPPPPPPAYDPNCSPPRYDRRTYDYDR
jgi:hypothetical protein